MEDDENDEKCENMKKNVVSVCFVAAVLLTFFLDHVCPVSSLPATHFWVFDPKGKFGLRRSSKRCHCCPKVLESRFVVCVVMCWLVVTGGGQGCEQNTFHASHFLVFHRTHFNVARGIGSRWLFASRHPRFMRSVCSDLLSILHFAFFTVSLILFILLIFIFIFHVSVRREVLCALPRMRGKTLWPTKPFSQVVSPTSSTISTSQRPLKSSSRSLPVTAGPRICMTGKSVTTPSVERSLHHCFRSEKMQRAVDKFITLLMKVCCQVSRCLSVMLEQ